MKVLKLPLSCSRRGQYQAKCKIQKQPARGSQPEVFLGKGVPKICSKFTGEHPCRSVILIKLLYNFMEIALRHSCSPVNMVHIFRTPVSRNTSGWLFLKIFL